MAPFCIEKFYFSFGSFFNRLVHSLDLLCLLTLNITHGIAIYSCFYIFENFDSGCCCSLATWEKLPIVKLSVMEFFIVRKKNYRRIIFQNHFAAALGRIFFCSEYPSDFQLLMLNSTERGTFLKNIKLGSNFYNAFTIEMEQA